jgi:molybdopterin-containing oxidoreductase family iron-sulfur binding subunit
MENIKKNTRRKFLNNSLKVGIATAIGGIGLTKLVSKLNAKTANGSSEKIELMTTDGTLIQVDSSEVIPVEKTPSKYNSREGFANRKFVMVVDLAKCKNALKCQQACNKGHYITGDNAWLKVYKMQEDNDTAPYWMPTQCQHCDQPACVTVCPVDATFKRRDGIVLIDNERCIGCRFCMAACPYSTRVFNWSKPDQGEITLGVEYTPDYCGKPSVVGTVDKCDFCPHQIVKEELPFCVNACPNGVFYFGDKYEDTVTNGDETLRLSELLKKKDGYRLMEDLGTQPSVYYLPPVDRLVDFEKGLDNYNEFQSVAKPE